MYEYRCPESTSLYPHDFSMDTEAAFPLTTKHVPFSPFSIILRVSSLVTTFPSPSPLYSGSVCAKAANPHSFLFKFFWRRRRRKEEKKI